MKKLVLATLSVAVLSGLSMADPQNPMAQGNNPMAQQNQQLKQEKLQEVKQKILSRIQEREQLLQQRMQFLEQKKTCIQNAQSFQDIKNCDMQFKEEVKSLKTQQKTQK
ncbi:hypothetical protein JCM14244_11800 [Venenivibrio stagnispumantis]|uniref:Uncharacterized protein n=1 Tax=Venenivibrio stagnispumantis TaxID=407998 RepID=A0AA45WNK8_9AQUI|nr:hypothetical protein [Venenivibrio stagnispumantis]MCW4573242.1 hypothetical protein [Venenivibrio stagnispumantis]SMP18417.1 hypothetical protein SAMN06264868_11730 [Venenivibrio stagnispumantis]